MQSFNETLCCDEWQNCVVMSGENSNQSDSQSASHSVTVTPGGGADFEHATCYYNVLIKIKGVIYKPVYAVIHRNEKDSK